MLNQRFELVVATLLILFNVSLGNPLLWGSDSQSMVSTMSASPENLLEMHVLGFPPRLTGPAICVLASSPAASDAYQSLRTADARDITTKEFIICYQIWDL